MAALSVCLYALIQMDVMTAASLFISWHAAWRLVCQQCMHVPVQKALWFLFAFVASPWTVYIQCFQFCILGHIYKSVTCLYHRRYVIRRVFVGVVLHSIIVCISCDSSSVLAARLKQFFAVSALSSFRHRACHRRVDGICVTGVATRDVIIWHFHFISIHSFIHFILFLRDGDNGEVSGEWMSGKQASFLSSWPGPECLSHSNNIHLEVPSIPCTAFYPNSHLLSSMPFKDGLLYLSSRWSFNRLIWPPFSLVFFACGPLPSLHTFLVVPLCATHPAAGIIHHACDILHLLFVAFPRISYIYIFPFLHSHGVMSSILDRLLAWTGDQACVWLSCCCSHHLVGQHFSLEWGSSAWRGVTCLCSPVLTCLPQAVTSVAHAWPGSDSSDSELSDVTCN